LFDLSYFSRRKAFKFLVLPKSKKNHLQSTTMANDENLAYDWRFDVADEPTEWTFNWEYAEGGTINPTPREFHATWFITMNADGDQIAALKQLLKAFGRKNPNIKLIAKPVDEDNIYKLKVKKEEYGCNSIRGGNGQTRE
jgi:hypothetical protein